MIEYTTRNEGSVAIWACYNYGDNYHEVNILGMDLSDIQPKLQEVADMFQTEINELIRIENEGQ
tara:strand:+ start:162 stop:353 length:192 start_codon:yes stop_codon:yes gene_type:complete